jgi:hypothetical protein
MPGVDKTEVRVSNLRDAHIKQVIKRRIIKSRRTSWITLVAGWHKDEHSLTCTSEEHSVGAAEVRAIAKFGGQATQRTKLTERTRGRLASEIGSCVACPPNFEHFIKPQLSYSISQA